MNLEDELRARLAPAGLDLLRPFRTGWIEDLPGAPLPDVRADALAIVVGNTRALWEPFVSALRGDPSLLAHAHPLDTYVAREIRAAAQALPVRSAFALSSDTPPIAIQRIADRAGLAWLSPAYLSVHAEHGPWISLRGVIVLDAPGPEGDPPAAPSPCHACERACEPALRLALAEGAPRGQADIARAADRWIAVRDACPVGRASRFGEQQLRYHYGKDRGLLARAARPTPASRGSGRPPP